MVKKMVGASSASESQESGSHDAGTLRVCFVWESGLIFFRILLASPKNPFDGLTRFFWASCELRAACTWDTDGQKCSLLRDPDSPKSKVVEGTCRCVGGGCTCVDYGW